MRFLHVCWCFHCVFPLQRDCSLQVELGVQFITNGLVFKSEDWTACASPISWGHMQKGVAGHREALRSVVWASMCSYIYTPEDIKKIIEEKRAKGDVRNAALEKARLMQLREAARGKGDLEEETRQVNTGLNPLLADHLSVGYKCLAP